jgi:hypothetical protein
MNPALQMTDDIDPDALFYDMPEEEPEDVMEMVPSDEHQPNVTRITRSWPAALVIDMALALDPVEDVLERYGLNDQQWDLLQDNPAFRLDLARTRKELAESGLSFKRKAATQAEMYLMDMDQLMQDKDVAPGTKVDIFKTCAKLGELEPKKDREGSDVSAPSVNVQINF